MGVSLGGKRAFTIPPSRGRAVARRHSSPRRLPLRATRPVANAMAAWRGRDSRHAVLGDVSKDTVTVKCVAIHVECPRRVRPVSVKAAPTTPNHPEPR
jgi:hypothetical protein